MIGCRILEQGKFLVQIINTIFFIILTSCNKREIGLRKQIQKQQQTWKPSLSSAFTFTLPQVGGDILPDQAGCSGEVRHSQGQSMIQKPLHHECFCTEPLQSPGRGLWGPASGLAARLGSGSAQGGTALPAQTVAAQSPSSLPVSSFPLVLWTQAGGRMELDGGVGGSGGPEI